MRIVINTIPLLSPLTGVGNYAYCIAQFLRAIDPINEYSYFYGYYSKKLSALYNENKKAFYRVKEFARKMPIYRGGFVKTAVSLRNMLSLKNFDLYFEPNFVPINIKSRCTVVTILDFSFELYPEWHPRERIDYFKKKFWKNIKKADKIIVISDYIKKEGVGFGLPEEQLTTIHLGFNREIFKVYSWQDLQAIKKKYGLPDHFILFVGSIEPRKNLQNLIMAYISLDRVIRKDLKLILVGFKGWQNKEIMNLLNKVKSDVLYLGYLPNQELGKLYGLATLFIYPSFYEGFGLPPLEAMACGCPVVVSNVSSLPEVCGDAARYVDPTDVDSIAEGMHEVLVDETLRRSLMAKGLERSKLFSWDLAARKHLEVFEDAAKNFRSS